MEAALTGPACYCRPQVRKFLLRVDHEHPQSHCTFNNEKLSGIFRQVIGLIENSEDEIIQRRFFLSPVVDSQAGTYRSRWIGVPLDTLLDGRFAKYDRVGHT